MRKLDLNAIYISEWVQETLRPVSVSALTAVVAPMGYGKTTAINWFLNQRRQTENAVILRVNIYSDNRSTFWKSVQNAFAAAGLTALAGCEYPEDASSAAQLMDDLCTVLAEMDECMPHYYKITNGHGMGAETIMRAEVDLQQGQFDDAQAGGAGSVRPARKPPPRLWP